MEENICGLSLGKKSLGTTPGAQSAKDKTDELVFTETVHFCSSTENEKILEKISAGHVSNKRFESGESEALTTQ